MEEKNNDKKRRDEKEKDGRERWQRGNEIVCSFSIFSIVRHP